MLLSKITSVHINNEITYLMINLWCQHCLKHWKQAHICEGVINNMDFWICYFILKPGRCISTYVVWYPNLYFQRTLCKNYWSHLWLIISWFCPGALFWIYCQTEISIATFSQLLFNDGKQSNSVGWCICIGLKSNVTPAPLCTTAALQSGDTNCTFYSSLSQLHILHQSQNS